MDEQWAGEVVGGKVSRVLQGECRILGASPCDLYQGIQLMPTGIVMLQGKGLPHLTFCL